MRHEVQAMVPRAALRPGQVFVYRFNLPDRAPWGRALIVIDRATEIDFWTGEAMSVGRDMPFEKVEVL